MLHPKGYTMNTLNITFTTQLPSLHMQVPAAPSEALEKETKRNERREDRRRSAQRQHDAMHPQATDKQVQDRWRILMQEHNLLMLKRICHERIRGAADRDELLTSLHIELASARCNTPLAEAIGLLDSEDGASGRGRAHRIITNKVRDLAKPMITHRDREISTDFTEAQRQAVTAAVKGDAAWGKVDYDIARTINHELAKRSGDPLGFDRRSEEFRRGSEKTTEITVGGRAYNAKGAIRIHKERSLVDMLTDTMRVGGLHETGRVDKEDSWTLKQWQYNFFNNWPVITNKVQQDFIITVMERAERLQTTKVRQVAWCLLQLTPTATPSVDRLVLMDIVRGDITSLGKLVASCSSGTQERQRRRKSDKDGGSRTDEYMKMNVTLILRVLGLEATSSERRSLSKLVERMAIEAGATAQPDKLAPYKSQQERFPTRFIEGREPLSKLALATASTGKQCNCERKVRLDKTGVSVLRYWGCTCKTHVRATTLFATREVSVLQQGMPFYNDFATDHKDRPSWMKELGAAACDEYLVYGSWPGCKMRAL